MTERYMVEIRQPAEGERCIVWTSPKDPTDPPHIVKGGPRSIISDMVGPVIVENGEAGARPVNNICTCGHAAARHQSAGGSAKCCAGTCPCPQYAPAFQPEAALAADLQPLVPHGPGRITDNRYVVTNLAFKPGDDDTYVVVTDTFATPSAAGWSPNFSFKVPTDAAPAIGEVVLLSWGQP